MSHNSQHFGLPKFELAGLYFTCRIFCKGFAKVEQVSEDGILFNSLSHSRLLSSIYCTVGYS